MLTTLKRLFDAAQADTHAPSALKRRHLQHAAAVLLYEARRADYDEADKLESAAAEQALAEMFGVGPPEATVLLEEGRVRAQQLASFYAPVAVIKREYSMPDRIRLVEHLWRIAFADGQLNLYEDHYVRKIAHLLNVSNTDNMLARNRARP